MHVPLSFCLHATPVDTFRSLSHGSAVLATLSFTLSLGAWFKKTRTRSKILFDRPLISVPRQHNDTLDDKGNEALKALTYSGAKLYVCNRRLEPLGRCCDGVPLFPPSEYHNSSWPRYGDRLPSSSSLLAHRGPLPLHGR